jgi:hypothetical protein
MMNKARARSGVDTIPASHKPFHGKNKRKQYASPCLHSLPDCMIYRGGG